MKLSLLFILTFLFSVEAFAQPAKLGIDYDYFLLGTLQDYMGREKYKGIDNRVDEYSQNLKPLVDYLDSVFRLNYPDWEVTINKKTGRLELQSAVLAQKINNYFVFTPSGRGIYNREEEIEKLNLDSLSQTPDFYTTYFDSLFTGKIKEGIFKNDTERFSFIAGAFIRFGGRKDSLYFIDVPNSTSKVRVATEQLKALKCSNVKLVVKNKYIPAQHKVYFIPTDELKSYLEQISLNVFGSR